KVLGEAMLACFAQLSEALTPTRNLLHERAKLSVSDVLRSHQHHAVLIHESRAVLLNVRPKSSRQAPVVITGEALQADDFQTALNEVAFLIRGEHLRDLLVNRAGRPGPRSERVIKRPAALIS